MRIVMMSLFLALTGCVSYTADEINTALARGDCAGVEAKMMPLAQKGDAGAVNNLGAVAENCRRDRAEAVRFYTLASRMGDSTARVNLTRLGEAIPTEDLVRRSSSSGDLTPWLMMLQAAQPRAVPSSNVNCTSRVVGSVVNTNCW